MRPRVWVLFTAVVGRVEVCSYAPVWSCGGDECLTELVNRFEQSVQGGRWTGMDPIHPIRVADGSYTFTFGNALRGIAEWHASDLTADQIGCAVCAACNTHLARGHVHPCFDCAEEPDMRVDDDLEDTEAND